MTEAEHGLHCNTVTGPRHGAGQGAGRAGRVGRHWGAQQALGHAAGAGARRRAAAGRRCRRAATERRGEAGARQGRSRRAGRAGWLRAVHSVHSACF